MNLMQRIDDIIEEGSLLKHQFYQMWSEGRLTKPMLAGYSKEYYQLVKAVPLYMENILSTAPQSEDLESNMREEYDHIPLWEDFAAGLGVPRDELAAYEGLEKTKTAVRSLHGLMDGYYAGAAAMYSLEKEIPQISRTKLEGLREFYGMDEHTEYFVQHMEADVRHAGDWRRILEASDVDDDEMARVAQGSVRAQNLLLDACYEEYCGNN